MLSTIDMSDGSGGTKPVIGTGNQKVKINSLTFDQTPYDARSEEHTSELQSQK